MSKDEDNRRQYQCVRKYEKIVKQFDELMDLMDAKPRPAKRRRVSSSSRGSNISSASRQASVDEVLAQTITRFLHELNSNPDRP